MSSDVEDETRNELVIVRRRGRGDHDGHHGGAWKIAYADFMTAMMAFFLVMWLVSMTDDKTIVQVAAYFNPLRLTERTPTSRGPIDTRHETQEQMDGAAPDKASAAVAGPAGKKSTKSQKQAKSSDAADKSAEAEAELFADPMKTLDRLGEAASVANAQGGNSEVWGDPRGSSGLAARNPYDPLDWSKGDQDGAAKRRGILDSVQSELRAKETAMEPPRPDRADVRHEAVRSDVVRPERRLDDAKTAADEAEAQKKAAVDTKADVAQEQRAKRLEEEIEKQLAPLDGARPQVKVLATPEGLLVRLSDDIDFGMFAVGSAEPLPATIRAMERIGAVLRSQAEPIVVSGHTDGRQYRSRAYDNWRLSAARAHMAHYMLLRNGVVQERIVRVEGHADRSLLNAKDKDAAENRRIEILLKRPAP